MKLKTRLLSVCIAFVLALGLLVVGVLASSQGTVNINGSVSFVANDVYAKVNGQVSGAIEAVDFEEINFSATYEPEEELDSWKGNDLNFENKNSVIKFEITIENLSTERPLYVDVTGNVGVQENVEKKVKYDGGEYNIGDIKQLAPSTGDKTSIATFTIELSIDNKNQSINKAGYDFTITLDNYDRSESNETEEKYTYNFDFSETIFDEYTIAPAQFALGEGNVYAISVYEEVNVYIDIQTYEIDSEVLKDTTLNFKIYVASGAELALTANGTEVLSDPVDDGTYAVYSYEYTITQNTTFAFSGMVWAM